MRRKERRGGKREGAGRPKEYPEPYITVSIRLPESVLKQLDAYVKQHKTNRPKALKRLLDNESRKQTVVKELKALVKNKEEPHPSVLVKANSP